MCSSPGGQNCIIQHLVSSHSEGGRMATYRCKEYWFKKRCQIIGRTGVMNYWFAHSIHILGWPCREVQDISQMEGNNVLICWKVPHSIPIHMLVIVFIWQHNQNGDDTRNMVRCRCHLSNSLLTCKMDWNKWVENLVCPWWECDVKHVFCIINLMWMHMTPDT